MIDLATGMQKLFSKYKKESRYLIVGNIIIGGLFLFLRMHYNIPFVFALSGLFIINIISIFSIITHKKERRKKDITQIQGIIYAIDFHQNYLDDLRTLFNHREIINEIFKCLADLVEKNAPLEDYCLLAETTYFELRHDFIRFHYAFKSKKGFSDIHEEKRIKEEQKSESIQYYWFVLTGLLIIIIGYSLFEVIGSFINA